MPRISKDTLERLFRFFVVGASFAGIYAVLSAFFVSALGMSAYWTPFTLHAICIPLGFLAQMRFTFRQSKTSLGSFLSYASVQVLCMASVLLITTEFITGRFFIDLLLYLVTAFVSAAISYVVCSWAFRSPTAS